jgi:SpoVK/Ycf46/Vps4 family AAA+-type ATPase
VRTTRVSCSGQCKRVVTGSPVGCVLLTGFINLSQSSLQNKWFGESVKLIRAVFMLAIKLQPTVIFIDEIDSFLRERSSSDHQAHADMKCEFMTLWDGIGTHQKAAVTVLGASNRPWDIDDAIQRRLSRSFKVDLPSRLQRKKILSVVSRSLYCPG